MRKLLIADDDATIRESLRTRFAWREMGFEIDGFFEDGGDVIRYLEERRSRPAELPDAILTDIIMYEQTGLDVAAYVQAQRLDIVVVLLSGYQEFEYAHQAIQYGVFDYIVKPVETEQFMKVFQRLAARLSAGGQASPQDRLEPEAQEGQIDAVKRYILEHLEGSLNVADIAYVAYLSPRQLQRVFISGEGKTLSRYILEARMERAEALLARGHGAASVAERVGFRDEKYFRHVFQSYHGYSVREHQEGRRGR